MKKSTIFHAISLAFLLTGCASAKVDEPIAKSEQPSLQVLILQGRDEEAKNLFITDINVNQLDSDRNTALHAAAAMGSVDMVDYLLAKGADPSIRNKDGNTPIHIAILNRKYETLRALAEFGDNIFITDIKNIGKIILFICYFYKIFFYLFLLMGEINSRPLRQKCSWQT